MSITQITTDTAGQIGVNPRRVKIVCDNTVAEVSTAGFLNGAESSGYTFYPTDFFDIAYSPSVGTIALATFTATFDGNGIITLSPDLGASSVTLPVVANHIAAFSGTSGLLFDNPTTAINGGNIQAGLSGTAGYVASFPSTSAKGSLRLTAVANTGNTLTTISNAAMGQASVISIPDPATATANFVVAPSALVSTNLVKASGTTGLVVDAGARLIANTTSSWGGGGTTNTFAATGLTVAAKGVAVIRTSTNSVSITKAVPGTDQLAITFSSDPGASTTVDYIYASASQA